MPTRGARRAVHRPERPRHVLGEPGEAAVIRRLLGVAVADEDVDFVCEAVAGLRYINGEPGRPPVRTNMALTDYITGTYAAFGAMLALVLMDQALRHRAVDRAVGLQRAQALA